ATVRTSRHLSDLLRLPYRARTPVALPRPEQPSRRKRGGSRRL
ncbi:MAG: hypothetical protein AVDCRST_MAG25-3586, partial [uncultured Rubrobacteraceae bacterium]